MSTGKDIALSTGRGGVALKSMDEITDMASIIVKSKMFPKSYDNYKNPLSEDELTAKVSIAIAMGMEVGLKPIQAVQNIAVIGNKPSIWGDAALALVMNSDKWEKFSEEFFAGEKPDDNGARCTVVRKDLPDPVIREYTMGDARRAGLLDKSGPWKTATKRMLRMRARAFALRDAFPDVLSGFAVAEEQQDITQEYDTAATPEAMPEREDYDIPDEPVVDMPFEEASGEPEAPEPPAEEEPPLPEAESPAPPPDEFGEPEPQEPEGDVLTVLDPHGESSGAQCKTDQEWCDRLLAEAEKLESDQDKLAFKEHNWDIAKAISLRSKNNKNVITTLNKAAACWYIGEK